MFAIEIKCWYVNSCESFTTSIEKWLLILSLYNFSFIIVSCNINCSISLKLSQSKISKNIQLPKCCKRLFCLRIILSDEPIFIKSKFFPFVISAI